MVANNLSSVFVLIGMSMHQLRSFFLTLDRSDFIYDIVEPMKPSVPAAGTKKISRKRPTVSSQFKVGDL